MMRDRGESLGDISELGSSLGRRKLSMDETMTDTLPSSSLMDDGSRRPAMKKSVAFRGVHSASTRPVETAKAADDDSSKAILPVFVPWSKWYRRWWSFTVFCSIMIVFTESYEVAFTPAGLYPYSDFSSVLQYILLTVFAMDSAVNFNLAYRDEEDAVIMERKMICKNYLTGAFWFDAISIFPFYILLLAATGELGKDSRLAQYLALVRLLRLLRFRRVHISFQRAQYSTKIALMWVTLTRNFSYALLWTHINGCMLWFIAKMYDFDDNNAWIGESTIEGMSMAQRYIVSLYWSVVTFATVGYGE